MSTAVSLRAIARQLDDSASLGRAVDDLIAARAEPPVLFGLGEPTHGIEAFPLLRNELLAHLVERGYRSIILETDIFAASIVDDYVCGSTTPIDTVLKTGFSHAFGAVPGNRELVEWLRAHNEDRAPGDRVHFYGFDAPLDQTDVPSPRRSLCAVSEFLPATRRPCSTEELATLLGDDADWTNPSAIYDPAESIGAGERARTLRVVADDLASALHRAGPILRPADPAGYDLAAAHARTVKGLLRFHAAIASRATDRIATMLGVRAEMMVENLLAILACERRRGPSLVFAHNVHLQRAQSTMAVGVQEAQWCGAGALIDRTLGERYVVVATDANPHSEPDTLHRALAEATDRRTLFPTSALRAALPPTAAATPPLVPGHIPVTLATLTTTDALLFTTDTDGTRVQYW
ncbi:erythromycin esterase family protein [Nocardia callitridis]|uniref:Erythromycin esterase family protein n=1 Tax=Nocardia callitridis TaxID=648753 RepID=A0ABP9K2J2_9NOCA